MRGIFCIAGLGLALAGAAPAEEATETPEEMVEVVIPPLDGAAIEGRAAFKRVCAECHGANGGGLDEHGPPLIYDLYGPAERSDFDLVQVIQGGIEETNWPFGPMATPDALGPDEIGPVIEFIRQVQIANGVE